jgi:hypothetical protein
LNNGRSRTYKRPPTFVNTNDRKLYSWFLRPPVGEMFDHRNWWNHCDKGWCTPTSAIYELARRHPRIGELRLRYKDKIWFGLELRKRMSRKKEEPFASAAFDDLGHEYRAIHCLCLIGLKIWPELSWQFREYWEMSMGVLKGVDCRSDLEQCVSLPRAALSDLGWERFRQLPLRPEGLKFNVEGGKRDAHDTKVRPVNVAAFKDNQGIIAEDLKKNPIPKKRIEKEIAVRAVAAYRAGDCVLSISPNISRARALQLFSRMYTQERKQSNAGADRARWQDWFRLIETYEDDETKYGGVKAQAFARYRRAMDGIDFSKSGR